MSTKFYFYNLAIFCDKPLVFSRAKICDNLYICEL